VVFSPPPTLRYIFHKPATNLHKIQIAWILATLILLSCNRHINTPPTAKSTARNKILKRITHHTRRQRKLPRTGQGFRLHDCTLPPTRTLHQNHVNYLSARHHTFQTVSKQWSVSFASSFQPSVPTIHRNDPEVVGIGLFHRLTYHRDPVPASNPPATLSINLQRQRGDAHFVASRMNFREIPLGQNEKPKPL